MNYDLEKKFVESFIQKRWQERIMYEFSKEKKRKVALSRFCHNADNYIKKNNIIYKEYNFDDIIDLIEFKSNEECYIISWDEDDGLSVSIGKALDKINNAGLSMILIFSVYSIVITEKELGDTMMYLLRVC